MLRIPFINGIRGFVILPSSLMWMMSLRDMVPASWSTAVHLSVFDLFFDSGVFSGA